jgi:exodeoxyribonuclease VII large subunit
LESHSLFELNQYIKRVIALNFPEHIWINCEIAQIKEVRGNVYIDLVEQDQTDNIIAQASAVIWYKSFLFIKNKLGTLTNSLLSEGAHVKIKVQVEFNERYGYKLVIDDIDPTYTLGRLEINRQKIIERLKEDNLFDSNKLVPLPKVIQKIAVISSDQAAGYKDFITQLSENQFGYQIEFHLYSSSMQGQNTEKDVCSAFDNIIESSINYDAVIIMRGGGSKLDLSFFDNYNIGAKIAKCPFPVLTGIGHEIDQSIADMVANKSLKTPTACADFIIERMMNFESELLSLKRQINQQALQSVNIQSTNLKNTVSLLQRRPSEIIQTQMMMQETNLKTIKNSYSKIINNELRRIELLKKAVFIANPSNILKRGFTLVKQNNTYLKNSADLNKNIKTEIIFHDGKVKI